MKDEGRDPTVGIRSVSRSLFGINHWSFIFICEGAVNGLILDCVHLPYMYILIR